MELELTTVQKLKAILPVNMHNKVTHKVVELLGGLGDELKIPQEYVEDTFISSVPSLRGLKRIDVVKHIEAIKYILMKQRTKSNAEAWKLCFPDKYQKIVDRGGSNNELQGAVSIYNSRPIIIAIEADIMVAMHIQYAGARHKAIIGAINMSEGIAKPSEIPIMKLNKETGVRELQYHDDGTIKTNLIYQVVTPKIQLDALALILDKTAIPIAQEIELKIGMSEEVVEANNNLATALREKAIEQRQALINGASIDRVQLIGDTIVKVAGTLDE